MKSGTVHFRFTKDDDNNLSVGNRNHLKLGIEPESWLQSHELGF